MITDPRHDYAAGETFWLDKDLALARRLNRILSLLPRYRTDRRWNASLLQRMIEIGQRCVPDIAVLRGQARIRTIKTEAGPINIRITAPPQQEAAGLYIHFHGGAWVIGNARFEGGLAREIALECQVVVAVIDFENARDDRLDKTILQCVRATEWLVDHLGDFGVDRVVIGGESSGAHLGCEALLHLRTAGKIGKVAGFYSMCGGFDLQGSPSLHKASRDSLVIDAPAAVANLRRLTRSLSNSLSHGPLHADLRGLPPSLFIAGSLDPIVDDSLEMNARWVQQNGNSRCILVPEAPHGFNRFPTSLAAKANAFARRWIGDVIRTAD
ncbi:alpha/beta hydrolase [Rhizobium sp. BK418]|uniref:alpha/beta hydrolase n=1 Tax=Rhizobium sp. BK418 TaxID=2512120 RepID=UPI0010D0CD54|nr:alpha/beta hydrolase [Rhizobium sp. BK418]TCR94972.1 acetyl esterase/lipase [Rhizobium sp. BK418]